jgi:hypothetical protein
MTMQSGTAASLEPDLSTDEEEEMVTPPPKKAKVDSFSSKVIEVKSAYKDSFDEEEELALRLLGRS